MNYSIKPITETLNNIKLPTPNGAMAKFVQEKHEYTGTTLILIASTLYIIGISFIVVAMIGLLKLLLESKTEYQYY